MPSPKDNRPYIVQRVHAESRPTTLIRFYDKDIAIRYLKNLRRRAVLRVSARTKLPTPVYRLWDRDKNEEVPT